jgi:hypothetical protein
VSSGLPAQMKGDTSRGQVRNSGRMPKIDSMAFPKRDPKTLRRMHGSSAMPVGMASRLGRDS